MQIDFIIVEDDATASMLLQRYCKKMKSLKFNGAFENAKTALEFLEKEPMDLIFLDIEMPHQSGIDLLNELSIIPLTIFTTSKPAYAMDAFEFNSIDFLKKPISFGRFQQAVQKVEQLFEKEYTLEKRNTGEVYIKQEGRYLKVNLEDVLYFESDADYIHIRTQNKTYTIIGALKKIEQKLPISTFFKVHQSYIVNLKKIVDIEDHSLLISKKVIPISRRNKALLFNRLNII